MRGGDFPVFAVTEMDRCHGGCHFQHSSDTPFKHVCVTYNATDFDCHCLLLSLFVLAVGGEKILEKVLSIDKISFHINTVNYIFVIICQHTFNSKELLLNIFLPWNIRVSAT